MNNDSVSHKLSEIANSLELAVHPGELSAAEAAEIEVHQISPLEQADERSISWMESRSKYGRAVESKAAVILCPIDSPQLAQPSLRSENLPNDLTRLLQLFKPSTTLPAKGIDPSAKVHSSAEIDKESRIGANVVVESGVKIGAHTTVWPGVFIGEGTVLGEHCQIWPNVVLREGVRIGDRVEIHSNTSIGADGFGYFPNETGLKKIPQIGTVEIEDDVEIGANVCIDRAKCGVTRIGAGTKIDNQVQIAHNVQIGPNCCVVAQSGIAGSAKLGSGVSLGGQVGVRDHIRIGSGARIAAASAVAADVAQGETVYGSPATSEGDYLKQQSSFLRLPNALRELRGLKKRVEDLEEQLQISKAIGS